jgi:hypothetical protein
LVKLRAKSPSPVQKTLDASLKAIATTRDDLVHVQRRASNWTLLILASGAMGLLTLTAFLGVGKLAWLMHKISSLSEEKGQLQSGVDHLAELGGRVRLASCGDPHRTCVHVEDAKSGGYGKDGIISY